MKLKEVKPVIFLNYQNPKVFQFENSLLTVGNANEPTKNSNDVIGRDTKICDCRILGLPFNFYWSCKFNKLAGFFCSFNVVNLRKILNFDKVKFSNA